MTSVTLHAIAIATGTAAIYGYQPLNRRASLMSAAVTGTAKIDAQRTANRLLQSVAECAQSVTSNSPPTGGRAGVESSHR